jgi:hypothetical protein
MLECFDHHALTYAGGSQLADGHKPQPKKLKLCFEVSLPQTSTKDIMEVSCLLATQNQFHFNVHILYTY